MRARLAEALSAARSEMRREGLVERRCTWLACAGYVVAALAAGPLGEDGCGDRRAAVWAPIAAGATVALVRAGRAGARAYELEAEVDGIERLADTLAGAPGSDV